MRLLKGFSLAAVLTALGLVLGGCGEQEEELVLRVSNWEEYIDLGDWDEDEVIELEDGSTIFGENAVINDFEDWYYETYGKKVRVEYSTFGTNEDLYNQLTIGDEFDLACPSEYMIMKMLREDMLLPYSEGFYDTTVSENYYVRGVSPYIAENMQELNIEGNQLSDYAACYFWGTLGLVYNPSVIDEEDVRSCKLLLNDKYNRRVTIKDSVRDAYFAAAAMASYDEITSEEFLNAPDYHERLSEMLNRTDEETVEKCQDILTQAKNNVYSFETDSGKADLATGKVVANQQWSGDAVYTMDQASEDGVRLCYSAPEEGTNLWFDGWVLLKSGIGEDEEKRQAAEAFVNFLSRPDIVIRDMYYVGYTAAVSGGEDDRIFQYVCWNYEAEEDETDTIDYPLGYFFAGDAEDGDERYCLSVPIEDSRSQVYAQYPPKEVVDRSVIMQCFPDEGNIRINRMWTNVRCFDLGF